MDRDLVMGVIGFVISFFTIHYTYTYLKKGKIRTVYVFDHNVYSFKKEPRKAYIALIFNGIVAILGFIGGIGFILLYSQNIK